LDKKSDISLVVFSPGSAETNIGWGGKVNGHLMASCVWNICTKNYQNLIIDSQVTVKNVRDVFLRHSVYMSARLFWVFEWYISSAVTVTEIGTGTTFFSNIEPYWNRSFVLSIDGFGFSISKQRSSSVDCRLPWTLNSMLRRNDRGAVTHLACFSGCRRYRPDQTEIACGAAFSIWEGEGGLKQRSVGKQSSVHEFQTVKWRFTAAELLVMRERRRDQLCNIYCNGDHMMICTKMQGGSG